MIASTHRSTPAFAVGGVVPEYRCIVGGGEVATHHVLAPRGLCYEHCYDHDWQYDRWERTDVCNECGESKRPDDYDYD